MRAELWRTAGQLLGLHLLLTLGLYRHLPLGERLVTYPALLAGISSPEVLRWVGPELLLSGAYLLGGLALAWALAAALARVNAALLWIAEGLTPFLLLVCAVWASLSLTLWRGWDFPLQPWSPVMLAIFVGALALPAAARAALSTRQARQGALLADHTRTARAMGLPERTVTRRADRVALPERAAGLAGEALGLTVSLVVMEGLLQFPGLGNEVYQGLQRVLGGGVVTSASVSWSNPLTPMQIMSTALLGLLGLGLLASWVLHALAARLDPRPRAGQDDPLA